MYVTVLPGLLEEFTAAISILKTYGIHIDFLSCRVPCCFVFSDFVQSLESLKADELVQMMQSFLSMGVAACQKGFERVTKEAKASLEEKRLLEDENCNLREENERLKERSHQLKDQGTKQQTAIDALKQELEKSLQFYEECCTEMKDMVTLYDAQ
jgi:hypothetical protein